eukprot:5717647-Amphidinium_carterae.1
MISSAPRNYWAVPLFEQELWYACSWWFATRCSRNSCSHLVGVAHSIFIPIQEKSLPCECASAHQSTCGAVSSLGTALKPTKGTAIGKSCKSFFENAMLYERVLAQMDRTMS